MIKNTKRNTFHLKGGGGGGGGGGGKTVIYAGIKKALKNISNRPTDRSIQKLRKELQYPYCRFMKGAPFSIEVMQKDCFFWPKNGI